MEIRVKRDRQDCAVVRCHSFDTRRCVKETVVCLVTNLLGRSSTIFSQSAPLPKYLHWLPARYRTIFKICKITYQGLSSTQPTLLLLFTLAAHSCNKVYATSIIQLYVGTIVFSIVTPVEPTSSCLEEYNNILASPEDPRLFSLAPRWCTLLTTSCCKPI